MTSKFEATKAALEEKRQANNLEDLAHGDWQVDMLIAELDKKRAALVELKAEIARVADDPGASDEDVRAVYRKIGHGGVGFTDLMRAYR